MLRDAPNMTTFQGTLRLYLTLPLASEEPYEPRGGLRVDLVKEMEHRAVALVGYPGSRLFPRALDKMHAKWVSCDDPAAARWRAPKPIPHTLNQDLM